MPPVHPGEQCAHLAAVTTPIPPRLTQHCAPALVQGPLGCNTVVFIPGIPVLALGSLWEHPSLSVARSQQLPSCPAWRAQGQTRAVLMISLAPQASVTAGSGDIRCGSGAGG